MLVYLLTTFDDCSLDYISLLWNLSLSALTLLVGQQEEHPAHKKLEWWLMRCWWHGWVWSELQMICIWSGWCLCHPIICFRKSRMVYPSGTGIHGSSWKKAVKWLCVLWNLIPKICVTHMTVLPCTRVVPKVSCIIYKHSTTTVTSLFFYVTSTNFSAHIPSFLQLLYSSLVRVVLAPKESPPDSDITVT